MCVAPLVLYQASMSGCLCYHTSSHAAMAWIGRRVVCLMESFPVCLSAPFLWSGASSFAPRGVAVAGVLKGRGALRRLLCCGRSGSGLGNLATRTGWSSGRRSASSSSSSWGSRLRRTSTPSSPTATPCGEVQSAPVSLFLGWHLFFMLVADGNTCVSMSAGCC
jgi:hypothetical protein